MLFCKAGFQQIWFYFQLLITYVDLRLNVRQRSKCFFCKKSGETCQKEQLLHLTHLNGDEAENALFRGIRIVVGFLFLFLFLVLNNLFLVFEKYLCYVYCNIQPMLICLYCSWFLVWVLSFHFFSRNKNKLICTYCMVGTFKIIILSKFIRELNHLKVIRLCKISWNSILSILTKTVTFKLIETD